MKHDLWVSYGPERGLLTIYGPEMVKNSCLEVYLLMCGLVKAFYYWFGCTVTVVVWILWSVL